MVVNAAKIACKYRNKFKKDIVIDLFCYRRRGHNEADDPAATQPLMYKKISKHPSVLKQYEENLISNEILSPEKAKSIKVSYRKSLEGGETVAKNLAKKPNDSLWFDWEPFMNVKWWPKVDTSFNKKQFKKLGHDICSIPKSFNLGSQAAKIFEDRWFGKVFEQDSDINNLISSLRESILDNTSVKSYYEQLNKNSFTNSSKIIIDNLNV